MTAGHSCPGFGPDRIKHKWGIGISSIAANLR